MDTETQIDFSLREEKNKVYQQHLNHDAKIVIVILRCGISGPNMAEFRSLPSAVISRPMLVHHDSFRSIRDTFYT